jgi:hypothetical protein
MKNLHKMVMNGATKNNMDIIRCYDMLTPNEFKNSIAYNIINSNPYNLYPLAPFWKMWEDPITNNLSTPELLDFYYKKYGIDNYTKNKNTILIKI